MNAAINTRVCECSTTRMNEHSYKRDLLAIEITNRRGVSLNSGGWPGVVGPEVGVYLFISTCLFSMDCPVGYREGRVY